MKRENKDNKPFLANASFQWKREISHVLNFRFGNVV